LTLAQVTVIVLYALVKGGDMPTVQSIGFYGEWIQIDVTAQTDISPALWKSLVEVIHRMPKVQLEEWSSATGQQYMRFTCFDTTQLEHLTTLVEREINTRGLIRILQRRIVHFWGIRVLIENAVWKNEDRWQITKHITEAFEDKVEVHWAWPPYKRTIDLYFAQLPTDQLFAAIKAALS
jgi:hypothetical protein